MLNPPAQYATDRNLRARQRLWEFLTPPFGLVDWVLDRLDVSAGRRLLDIGCGNGRYLGPARARGAAAVGCDRSRGMLQGAPTAPSVQGDVVALPFATGSFDRVLAAHMLYHVEDRPAAVRELRRVLARGGVCVVVTNGLAHTESIRVLVERAVHRTDPDWRMTDSGLRLAFSLENGAAQMRAAFDEVQVVRPERSINACVRDADVVADYVASVGDHYARGLSRSWSDVVEEVRAEVRRVIEAEGAFTTASDPGAFLCR